MMSIKKKIVFVCLLTGILSCNNQTEEYKDTLKSGEVNIAIDDSYTFLLETLIRVFEDQNPDAKIKTLVRNESSAINAMLYDSCKVIVMNRELTKSELSKFKSKNIYPKSIRIAYDAVALIVHPDRPDSTLDLEDLKSILTGKISKWNELGGKDPNQIVVVFDKPNSANYAFMKDTLLGGKELGKNCFGVNSNKEVIDYITKNKNAIGIVSSSWITDEYSNLAKTFLKSVKVLAIGNKESGSYYKPYQYYIHNRNYPLVRSVFLINRQTRMGLGMGFVNFVCKADKGQFIITKSGLVPVYSYIREVNSSTE